MMQQMQEMMQKALHEQRLTFESTLQAQRAEQEAREQAQLAKQRELQAELAETQTRNLQAQNLLIAQATQAKVLAGVADDSETVITHTHT